MINTKTKLFSTYNKLKHFLLFALTLHVFVCSSQTKLIDSLRTNIFLAKNDHQKLQAIFRLCDEANSINTDSLYNYCMLANAIAHKNNNASELFQLNYYKAILLSKKGQLDSTENLIDSSLSS
ncbi:MAG TPA: hypothetical protein VEV62_12650 [Parafilimonas sp.]|nr:hypothetical protein [Parafilimonas sp.]